MKLAMASTVRHHTLPFWPLIQCHRYSESDVGGVIFSSGVGQEEVVGEGNSEVAEEEAEDPAARLAEEMKEP